MELTKPTVLALYDPKAPTKVSADTSSYGLGAVLLQQKGSEWKPIVYASRSMTETESWYAQIEKEALATTWACEKFSTYILGMKFAIETDHKPLVPLLDFIMHVLCTYQVFRFIISCSTIKGVYAYHYIHHGLLQQTFVIHFVMQKMVMILSLSIGTEIHTCNVVG